MDPRFVHTNQATTTAPQFVPHAISTRPELLPKVEQVIVERMAETYQASLYRISTYAPSMFSRDIHRWDQVTRHWIHERKDPQKYPTVPRPPSSAARSEIEGVTVWTPTAPTESEIDLLKSLIFVIRQAPPI
jgi:hypothetical protein